MENNMNSQTALQQSETPVKCATGCGFFGTASTMNLCSKCYRDHRLKEEQSAAAIAAVGKSMTSAIPPNSAVSEDINSYKLTAEKPVATAEVVAEGSKKAAKSSNRCGCCNKKVGVVGFKCRCGSTFCGSHRYAEEHNCEFDYKVAARQALAKANPLVIADKLQRI